MKVYFSTYPFAYITPGGGERQLEKYLQYLLKLNVNVSRYDPWSPPNPAGAIVHFFSCMPGSYPFLHYLKQRGAKIIVSPNLWVTPDTVDQYPFEQIQAILDLCDCIICNSMTECDMIAEVFKIGRGKFHCIFNCVDLSIYEYATVKRSSADFVTLANIEPRKNQLQLIETMKSFPDKRLTIIGNVRDHDYYRRCLAIAGNNVVFAGGHSHLDKFTVEALRSCELFILPSMLETPGLSALEAFALGANVLLTKIGSTVEYFGDKVNYFDPHKDNLEQDIRHALRSNASRLTVDERKVYISRYIWDSQIPNLLKIYENIN